MSKPAPPVRAVQLEDVPAIGQMVADSFFQDRQTQMKNLGSRPYDVKEVVADSLPGLLQNPRAFAIKVVDPSTGEIMGYCNWGFRGFDPQDLPKLEGKPRASEEATVTQDGKDEQQAEEPRKDKAYDGPTSDHVDPETDPIARLQALTGADMEAWMEEVMPEGTRCLYIVGLSVSPKYQGRGVGSALLRWGLDICDAEGVFAWVHSSEPAWKMYEKSSFQTIRTLDVDLDEYAPGPPPPNEGPDAKWGHYVFRYMKYYPRDVV